MNHDDMPARTRNLDARLFGLVSLVLLVLTQVCACGPLPRIEGTDMGPKFQSLRISRDGQPVNGAAVTVNGAAIARSDGGLYQIVHRFRE